MYALYTCGTKVIGAGVYVYIGVCVCAPAPPSQEAAGG